MMSIELNWALFRRLVQLELAALMAIVPVAVVELLIPRYSAFGEAFDSLAAEHQFIDAPDALVLTIFLPFTAAYVVSLLGMLRRSRLARSTYLATFIIGWTLAWLIFKSVSWLSPVGDFFTALSTMISGAVILLAYSREHCAKWFAPHDQQIEEIFT